MSSNNPAKVIIMDPVEEERLDRMERNLKYIDSQVVKLVKENNELKARNEELEKENKKLHETILKISQNQNKSND